MHSGGQIARPNESYPNFWKVIRSFRKLILFRNRPQGVIRETCRQLWESSLFIIIAILFTRRIPRTYVVEYFLFRFTTLYELCVLNGVERGWQVDQDWWIRKNVEEKYDGVFYDTILIFSWKECRNRETRVPCCGTVFDVRYCRLPVTMVS
jgi:hypothetical protein